jgi:cobalt-precorrin-5B (C1)-methyltransferase
MRTISSAGAMKRRTKKHYYTTGVYFAAAAAASARMLVTGERVDNIEIETLSERRVSFELAEQQIKDDYAGCSIIKDAGDEEDATHGMRLNTRAQWAKTDMSDIFTVDDQTADISSVAYGHAILIPGEGIGIVTKPGLCVPVGRHALHPQNKEIIRRNASVHIPPGKTVEVHMSIPCGEKLAERTSDLRLGIKGGISLFETAGTVRPALNSGSLRLMMAQVDIAAATGFKTLAVSLDDIGVKAAGGSLRFEEDAVISVNECMGETLGYCVKKGIEEIVIIGCLAEILLIAGGGIDIKQSGEKEPAEVMKRIMREHTKDLAPLFLVMMAESVEDAASGLIRMGQTKLLDEVAGYATQKVKSEIDSSIEIGTVITCRSGHVLAGDIHSRQIIRKVRGN